MTTPSSRRAPPQVFQVSQNLSLSPNMRRITLAGKTAGGFSRQSAGRHVKVLLARDPQTSLDLQQFPQNREQIIVRTYTVRDFDPQTNVLTIDFALHSDNPGPASEWALHAKPGDQIGIAGPGPLKMDIQQGDWFLFCADMTSIPAASAIIESLPADARGYAVFEITSDADCQPINLPPGIEVHWLLHPHPQNISYAQTDCLKTLNWLPGTPNIFVAGEGHAIRHIRQYLMDERNVSRRDMYTSPYWKIGLSEDQHQLQKRNEMD